MSKEHPSSNLQMIPIDKIEILNPRERNSRIFDDIVGNIKNIGLKKPITVTPRKDGDGREKFLLICGEGRLKAFKSLGETTIPAMVVDVSDEDGFIMSLAENIARRGYRPLEILADIEVLRKRGYSAEIIIQKTGLSPKYVKDIVFLLDQGEERLIEGVQRGTIPLTTALEIARANENVPEGGATPNLGDLLQEAYENGQLKGRQIIEAKRLIEKRMEHGPASPNRDQIKPPTSSYSLVRTYQREVERQRKMVLKAEHAHLFIQTLQTQMSDRLDFHEVSVWAIQSALEAAYEAGRAEAMSDSAAPKQTKRN